MKKEITSWYDVRHMIARNEFVPKLMNQLDQNGKIVLDAATGTPKQVPVLDAEGNPVMERQVSVQTSLLEKSLVASARLKELGINSIAAPKYRPGTTVVEAYEIDYKKTKGSLRIL